MVVFSRNTNYIVEIRGYDGTMKIVVLGYDELELLLDTFNSVKSEAETLTEGTIVFSAKIGFCCFIIREYQGGEIDSNTFRMSPSTYDLSPALVAV